MKGSLVFAGVVLALLVSSCTQAATPTVTSAPISQPAPLPVVAPAHLEQVSRDILDIQFVADGATGTVTYRLHEGLFNGKKAYFIRADASDEQFAKDHGLVFAQLLEEALDVKGPQGERAVQNLYLFRNGVVDQSPILSTVPQQPDYTPLFQVHWVTWQASPSRLTSIADLQRARSEGKLALQDTRVIVNYPVVKWPGGEMPNTAKLEPYLEGGQLIGPVDVQRMRVTFKLHRCYPEHLYIVTDSSDPGMAEGMKVVYAPRTALLLQGGPKGASAAMAQVFVLGNGPKGDGPMGFQSSMMDPAVDDESWSSLWNHFTVTWRDESKAKALTGLEDFKKRLDRGEFQLFNGVPDTHPKGFGVNCPVPAIRKAG